MERRDRDRHDYDRYEGYNPDDDHYHSARNLTNEFERGFQRDRGYRNDDRDHSRMHRSYHEGDMGDAYERMSGQDSYRRGNTLNRQPDRDWDNDSYTSRHHDRNSRWGSGSSFDSDHDRSRFSSNRNNDYRNADRYSSNYDRFGSNQAHDRHDHDMNWRNRDRSQDMRNGGRQIHGVSTFDGRTARYDVYTGDETRPANMRDSFSGSGYNDMRDSDNYRSSRYSDDRSNTFSDTYRGDLSSGFGTRDFHNDYGTGRSGSSGSFGSMGGNTYNRDRGNITGDNAYNSDRRY